MGEEFIRDGLALGAQLGNSAAEIDRVSQDHGGNCEIEPGGAVALVLEGAVADFSVAMKEHSPGERVTRLAFVQSRV